MSVYESLSLALSNLKGNKMRSALTLLGVIIGIASVIVILTLGSGLKSTTQESLSSVGGTDLGVEMRPKLTEEELEQYGGEEFYYFSGRLDDPEYEINGDDIEQLQNQFGSQISHIGLGQGNSYPGEVFYEGKTTNASLQFVNVDLLAMQNIKVEAGRSITEEDISNNRPVAIIPKKLVELLFDGNVQAALGSEISHESEEGITYYTVVGIEKTQELGLFGLGGSSNSIYVPHTVEVRLSDRAGMWQNISVRANPEADTDRLISELQAYFDKKVEGNTMYEAKVRDNRRSLDEFNKIINVISVVIAGIGGISLLVGGIGVMNIMLITVTERTREIGIRKALGANRGDIRRQFVIEAMVVCTIGGIIGVLLGGSLGSLIGYFMFKGAIIAPPVWGVLISLCFCLAIGLFFGWYPANRAAKLDPIEALRYE